MTSQWKIGKTPTGDDVSVGLEKDSSPVTLMFGVADSGKSYRIQSLLKELNKDYDNVEIVLSVPDDAGYEKEAFIHPIVNDMDQTRVALDEMYSRLSARARDARNGAPHPAKKLVFILDGNKLPTTDHGPESEVHDILSYIARVSPELNAHLIISRRTIMGSDRVLFDALCKQNPAIIILGEPTHAVSEYFNLGKTAEPTVPGCGVLLVDSKTIPFEKL